MGGFRHWFFFFFPFKSSSTGPRTFICLVNIYWMCVCVCVCVCVFSVPESCPTLCDPMDYSPPGSSVHGILQARILEWVVGSHSLLQGIFPIQGSNPGLLHWRVGSLSSEPPAKRYSRPRTNERTACAESKDKSTWCSPAGLEHSVGEEQHRWAEDLAGLRSCSVFKPTPWHAEEQ